MRRFLPWRPFFALVRNLQGACNLRRLEVLLPHSDLHCSTNATTFRTHMRVSPRDCSVSTCECKINLRITIHRYRTFCSLVLRPSCHTSLRAFPVTGNETVPDSGSGVCHEGSHVSCCPLVDQSSRGADGCRKKSSTEELDRTGKRLCGAGERAGVGLRSRRSDPGPQRTRWCERVAPQTGFLARNAAPAPGAFDLSVLRGRLQQSGRNLFAARRSGAGARSAAKSDQPQQSLRASLRQSGENEYCRGRFWGRGERAGQGFRARTHRSSAAHAALLRGVYGSAFRRSDRDQPQGACHAEASFLRASGCGPSL